MPKAKKNRSSSASSGCGDVQANDMRSDIAEMKTSLRFLCESFDDIKSSNHKLEKALSEIHKLNQQLSGRVVELEKENQRKDATIDNLEKAVESLEMYSKKNNVVFSGLDLKATTFARVARVAGTAEEQGAGEQSGGEFATLRAKVLGFVNHTMNVRMETNDIVACHELPARKNETVKPVIVCLLNSAVKRDLMMGRKTLKGSRIFVNEQLTKKNAGLFKKARELRRNGVIDSTWTYNGRVFVKKTQTATPEEIRVEDDLQSFSRK